MQDVSVIPSWTLFTSWLREKRVSKMLNETYRENITSPYTDTEQVFILLVMSFISVGSIGGNTIVFVAYLKIKKLQRATNYFILSLAAADLFVGMIVVNIYTMYMLLGYWPSSDMMCLLWLCSDYWVFQASVFGVLMIAMDRYLSIRFPHRYRHKRSDVKVKVAIFMMWVFSFVLWVPLIVSYSIVEESSPEDRVCHIRSSRDVYVTALASAFAYVIPVLMIIALATHTFHLLLNMKQSKTSKCYVPTDSSAGESSTYDKSLTESNEHEETEQAGSPAPVTFTRKDSHKCNKSSLLLKQKDSKLVPITLDVKKVCKAYKNINEYQRIATFNIVIAVAFVVTVCPYGVISVVKSFCHECVSPAWWHFGYIMCYINSLLNPLCYAFGNKNFNRAFKTILCPFRANRNLEIDYSRTPSMKDKIEDHRLVRKESGNY